jgi:hypothetical protein
MSTIQSFSKEALNKHSGTTRNASRAPWKIDGGVIRIEKTKVNLKLGNLSSHPALMCRRAA